MFPVQSVFDKHAGGGNENLERKDYQDAGVDGTVKSGGGEFCIEPKTSRIGEPVPENLDLAKTTKVKFSSNERFGKFLNMKPYKG